MIFLDHGDPLPRAPRAIEVLEDRVEPQRPAERELRVVTFGSLLEETPEGLHAMDRVRRREAARRAALSPVEQLLEDLVADRVARSVLYGNADGPT